MGDRRFDTASDCTNCLVLTCIEFGISVPVILFMLGLDDQAAFTLFVVLTLAALSQIPKRLVHNCAVTVVS